MTSASESHYSIIIAKQFKMFLSIRHSNNNNAMHILVRSTIVTPHHPVSVCVHYMYMLSSGANTSENNNINISLARWLLICAENGEFICHFRLFCRKSKAVSIAISQAKYFHSLCLFQNFKHTTAIIVQWEKSFANSLDENAQLSFRKKKKNFCSEHVVEKCKQLNSTQPSIMPTDNDAKRKCWNENSLGFVNS